MKVKRFFKIILLICCFLLTAISTVLMYTVIVIQNGHFEYSMLFPLSMIPTGILSVIYHVKTLKYYSLSFVYNDLNDGFLWIGNLLFAVSTASMGFFMMYSLYSIGNADLNSELILIFVFCSVIVLIAAVLVLEERWLYRRLLYLKDQSKIDEIEDISGFKDNDFKAYM